MKLEVDLIRDLLLFVEVNAARPVSHLESIALEGWSEDQIAYHIILAEEDGLIKALVDEVPGNDDPENIYVTYTINRLTSRGHELLGVVRQPKHWRIIKAGAAKAGVATIGALFSLGQAYMATLLPGALS